MTGLPAKHSSKASKEPTAVLQSASPYMSEEPEVPLELAWVKAVAEVFYEDRSCDPPLKGAFQVMAGSTIKVGRVPQNNQLVFRHGSVSRYQLEFFAIYIDEDHCPMVYVRDRQSLNGTYVNGVPIGRRPTISVARLLGNGDTIEIQPHITFKFHQLIVQNPSFALTSLQRLELELVKERFVVTDRTIGCGSHGTVYVGVEVKTGKQIVCKIHDLKKDENAHPDDQRRIRQEANLMSHLDHPHVLAFKQAFESPNNLYIFTELATGGDLFSLMGRQNFSEFEIRLILRQVLRGVAHLHAKGVVHRDIKPENILCAVAPAVAHRMVLTDLGLAGMICHGRMKSNVGTETYKAPEILSSDNSHGFPVDIWSVGILTLQLFAGPVQLPKLKVGSQALISADLNAYFLHVLEGTLSEAAEDFICSCLMLDSDQRPSAWQALSHPWLQEPREDREAFEELEGPSIACWTPRDLIFPAIEDLSRLAALRAVMGGVGLAESIAEGSTASPHFRVLQEVTPSPHARNLLLKVAVHTTATSPNRTSNSSPVTSSSASSGLDDYRQEFSASPEATRITKKEELLSGTERPRAYLPSYQYKRRAVCSDTAI